MQNQQDEERYPKSQAGVYPEGNSLVKQTEGQGVKNPELGNTKSRDEKEQHGNG